MPLILPGNVASATAAVYSIDNSCRFDAAVGTRVSRTSPSDSATNEKLATMSFWMKTGGAMPPTGESQIMYNNLGSGTPGYFQIIYKPNTIPENFGQIKFAQYGHSQNFELKPNRLFVDPTAWYHIVIQYDSTDATPSASDNKLWINGVQETSFATEVYPDQNNTANFTTPSIFTPVGNYTTSTASFNGYLAEWMVVDGQALPATSFGEFDPDSPSIWRPIDISGITLGVQGYYLDFKDSSNMGNEAGGGADFSVTGIAAVDQMTDSPTNNFCVPNVLDNYFAASAFSEGNCKIVTNSSNYSFNTGTFGLTAGKWYFEADCATAASANKNVVGISAVPSDATDNYLGADAYMWSYYGNNGNSITGGSSSSYGDSYTDDDVVGVAIDLDNSKLYFAKNNTWQDSGDPTSGATGTGALSITAVASTPTGVYFPAMGDFSSDSSTTWEINFGNPVAALSSAEADANGYGNFEYAPPSGYLSICTKNLGSDGG